MRNQKKGENSKKVKKTMKHKTVKRKKGKNGGGDPATEKKKREEFPWKKFNGIEENPSASDPFHSVPGPSRQACQASTVEEVFSLFLPTMIVKQWVDETNRYSAQMRRNKPSKWDEVFIEELLAYIGMVIAMGLVNLPSVHDYFATDPILSHPWFPSIMSRRRFCQISQYLHVSNEDQYPNDKLAKIRSFVDHLVPAFQKHWTPHREISIDEQMIGTRCRVGFIQYMPKKPVKFGVKNWVLADSVFPYVCNFQIYTGKDERTSEDGLVSRVVMDLVEPYLNRNHRLYMDNFYTSPSLCVKLYEKGTLSCGTVRQDRKLMPASLMIKNTPKYRCGESTFLKHHNLTVVRWKDKRDVFALSTFHGNACDDDLPHKPKMIENYNKFMNGVDRADQLLTYYSMDMKSRKWWKKVFWRLVELCITNAYQVTKFQNKDSVHKKFRLSLAYCLCQPLLDLGIGNSPRTSLQGPGRPSSNISRLKGKHFSTGAKKGSKRGRCKVCGSKRTVTGKRKDTKTGNKCLQCDVFLCEGKCFMDYHTKAKL